MVSKDQSDHRMALDSFEPIAHDFHSADDYDQDQQFLSGSMPHENDRIPSSLSACSITLRHQQRQQNLNAGPRRHRLIFGYGDFFSEEEILRRREKRLRYYRFSIHVLGPVFTVCFAFTLVLCFVIPTAIYFLRYIVLPYLPFLVAMALSLINVFIEVMWNNVEQRYVGLSSSM